MELAPGVVVGQKYVLDRPLARGGMGSVWLGRHRTLDSQVALKFMRDPEDATPTARARFEREAKAAAQLPSPNIVQILDYGVDDDAPYLVMEYLEGEDLSTRLERDGRLTLSATSAIIGQIAKALTLAHDGGIIHRDLKPSNVFLARTRGEETVKLLDFGVAKVHRKLASEESTASGELLGSPQYMSPEQARGGELDARSDLWSLGVIAFVALTGHRPFTGANLGDVLVKICVEEVPRATALAPHLPKEVDHFFARALCRSPDGRFQSARALADALAAIAEGKVAPHPLAARDDETLSLAGSVVTTAPRAKSRWRSWRTWATVGAGALGTIGLWLAFGPVRRAPAAAPAPEPPPPIVASAAPVHDDPGPAPIASVPAPAPSSARRPPIFKRPRVVVPSADPKPAPVDPKFGLPTGSSP